MADETRKRPSPQAKDAPAPKTAPKSRKKESRPRLDAILRAIKDGRYDDDMGVLQGAINDRQRVRQEAVLQLVQQTFGDGYTVTAQRQNPVPTPPAAQPQNGGALPEGWVDETDKAVAAQEPTTTTVEATIEGEDEEGIESRSPIIGPFNPGAPAE